MPNLAKLLAIACAVVVVGFHVAPVSHADPGYQPYTNDFSGLEGAWTAEKDGPQEHSQVHIDWDVPIVTSDGTVLKANVYRPMDGGRGVDEPLPTILNVSPYTKWLMPRPDMTNQRLYLRSEISGTAFRTQHDGSLSAAAPTDRDQLTVRVGVASLCSDITNTQYLGITAILMACAQDERPHEVDGLTFTSTPVSVPTVISGPVAVHLNTVHEGTDGFWMATVSDVDPQSGNSLPLSTGWVVSSLRKVDETRSKRGHNGDYVDPIQTIDVRDYVPVSPGDPTTIDFGTYPLDAVLQPGDRLRVSLYSSNYPSAVPPMPMMMGAGLTPPPHDVRDAVFLFTPGNTWYPEHLNIDPSAPSWVSIPTSDPIH